VVEHQDRVIGKVGIWDQSEIGYILHPDTWGQGIATEAVKAVCQHCIETLGMRIITADVDPRNTVSIHLLCKLGFVETERAERTLQVGDEWCDSIYYALSPGNFRAALRGL
jgi:RimJ/RimL family protein N-acetyltransferase